jgi:hypothetical protein
MKIKNAKNYRFPNALHLQFVLEVLGLMNKFKQILSKVVDLFGIFNGCVEKEDSCFKIVRKSNLSNMKEESDKARDAVIVGIKHLIKAGIRHFDKEIREAAQRLKIVFDSYDKPVSITALSYDAETAVINNLIHELNNKYASDMQKVGITSWIEELQIKNNDFDYLVKNYHEEMSAKPDLHLIDLRKNTDKAYQDIITLVNALILVDKETSYDQFVTELNTLIKHYNDLYAQHIGRMK